MLRAATAILFIGVAQAIIQRENPELDHRFVEYLASAASRVQEKLGNATVADLLFELDAQKGDEFRMLRSDRSELSGPEPIKSISEVIPGAVSNAPKFDMNFYGRDYPPTLPAASNFIGPMLPDTGAATNFAPTFDMNSMNSQVQQMNTQIMGQMKAMKDTPFGQQVQDMMAFWLKMPLMPAFMRPTEFSEQGMPTKWEPTFKLFTSGNFFCGCPIFFAQAYMAGTGCVETCAKADHGKPWHTAAAAILDTPVTGRMCERIQQVVDLVPRGGEYANLPASMYDVCRFMPM